MKMHLRLWHVWGQRQGLSARPLSTRAGQRWTPGTQEFGELCQGSTEGAGGGGAQGKADASGPTRESLASVKPGGGGRGEGERKSQGVAGGLRETGRTWPGVCTLPSAPREPQGVLRGEQPTYREQSQLVQVHMEGAWRGDWRPDSSGVQGLVEPWALSIYWAQGRGQRTLERARLGSTARGS